MAMISEGKQIFSLPRKPPVHIFCNGRLHNDGVLVDVHVILKKTLTQTPFPFNLTHRAIENLTAGYMSSSMRW